MMISTHWNHALSVFALYHHVCYLRQLEVILAMRFMFSRCRELFEYTLQSTDLAHLRIYTFPYVLTHKEQGNIIKCISWPTISSTVTSQFKDGVAVLPFTVWCIVAVRDFLVPHGSETNFPASQNVFIVASGCAHRVCSRWLICKILSTFSAFIEIVDKNTAREPLVCVPVCA